MSPRAAITMLGHQYALEVQDRPRSAPFCAALLLQGVALALRHPEYAAALLAASPETWSECSAAADEIVTTLPVSLEAPPCADVAATGEDR